MVQCYCLLTWLAAWCSG